jgi:hypothetical protein
MQLRSSNSSVATLSSKRNPTIIAFDMFWQEIYRMPLSQVEGMAYGVRDDYEAGYRGIKSNQCVSDVSRRVHYWSTPSI